MADVAELEGVAVICRDSSRLRDDVHGTPVLGFARSPDPPSPMAPIRGENSPEVLTASASRAGAVFQIRNGPVAALRQPHFSASASCCPNSLPVFRLMKCR